MPRQKSIVTIIRDLVRSEIQKALSGLFGGLHVGSAAAKPKPKNGRRRRRRRKSAAKAAPKRGRRGRRRKAAPSEA
jgi:hypothetical protein